MSKEVDRFMNLLANRGLLSERALSKLFRQIEDKRERGKGVPLDSLAKLLVDKGHLTQRQANSLINEVSQSRQDAVGEEIGLAPIDDGPRRRNVRPAGPREEDAFVAETKAYEEELSEAEIAALAQPKRKKRERWAAETERPAAEQPKTEVDDPLGELPASVGTSGKRVVRGGRRAPRSEWESPLLLVGGGGLLLLVLVGLLVWYLLRTDTGDAQLRAAREAYQDGAYAQAVEAYERFLDSHSDHDAVSAARVQLGLARLRRTLQSGAGFDIALQQAQSIIAEIEREPAFKEAARDLADILPEIAQGLADEASRATSPETAAACSAKTEEALALLTNTKYVPKSFRPVGTIEDIRRTLASVERRQQRQQTLSAALDAMAKARDGEEFQKAYNVYTELVGSYPDVAELPAVRAAVAQIAGAEVAALGIQEEQRPASTEERESAAAPSLLLTAATANGADQSSAAMTFVRIAGAVYGIDAATGQPVWRRFVAHDDRSFPQPLAGGDVLVVDAEHGELLRLDGRTGKLVWRQTVGEVTGKPVIHERRALVPAEAKLVVVDVETGEAQGFVAFAQPLAASPAIDAESNRLAVVGERSVVYLLAADSLEGEDALFVGHAAGSVSVPPALFSDALCLTENFAVRRSLLHVIAQEAGDPAEGNDADEDRIWKASIEPIRLKGRVTTPLAVRGRRLAVATDLGEIRVFDVPVGTNGPPISPVASRDASGDESHERYVMLRESDLWLAGTRLARLRILSTGGRLQLQDLPRRYDGDAFVHPLMAAGDQLVHVRRPQDKAGYFVAATSLQSGEPLWEHELAAPPTDLSVVPDGSAIAVASAGGRLYVVPSAWGSGSEPGPLEIASDVVAPQGIAAMTWLAGRAVAHSLGGDGRLRQVELTASGITSGELRLPDRVAAAPIALGGQLIVPLRIGQVLLIDPVDGQAVAAPFQPAIRPDELPDWTSAAVVDPQGTFAIADRSKRVYLVELQTDPARLSPVAASPDLPHRITGEICASRAALFAAAGNRLLTYDLPALAAGQSIEFDRRIVWGPFSAGDVVLLATADERLHGFVEGRTLAEASLSAPAIGRPSATEDGSILLALGDGTIVRVDAATGDTTTHGTFGQPLAAGPAWLNGRVFAATIDGALVAQTLDAPAKIASASR